MQLTWQDMKNLTDGMSQEQLNQPLYVFEDFTATWLSAFASDTLKQGDVQQIKREGLGTAVIGIPYLFVADDV